MQGKLSGLHFFLYLLGWLQSSDLGAKSQQVEAAVMWQTAHGDVIARANLSFICSFIYSFVPSTHMKWAQTVCQALH